MATATIDVCQLCANSFNSDFYRSVSLPCGHPFCLLCLVRLEASGKRQCPTCRSSWVGFDVPPLPGMEALAGTLQLDQEEEDSCKEKGVEDTCNKHSMLYDFWVSTKKEFYCKGCAAENPPVKLELIQNALPQIKAALAVDVPNAMKEVESHLQSLDDMHAEFVRQRNSVVQFMRAVQTLNNNITKNIDQIAAFRSKVLDTAVNLKKLDRKVDSIKSTADLHVAVKCKSTLEKAAVRFSPPTPDLSQTLLFNIACGYVEEAEMVCAAEKLKNGEGWTVDINNCDAALLALADKQPYMLTLKQGDDGRKVLPVAALAKAAKNCGIYAKFIDTFYSASNTATDAERLEHLLANKRCPTCLGLRSRL